MTAPTPPVPGAVYTHGLWYPPNCPDVCGPLQTRSGWGAVPHPDAKAPPGLEWVMPTLVVLLVLFLLGAMAWQAWRRRRRDRW